MELRGSPRTRLAIATLVLAVGAAALAADRLPIRVLRVVDGDTVVAGVGVREFRVRLLGIDAPEVGRDGRRSAPHSQAATRFTRDLILRSRSIALEVAGDRVDEHGRTLGFLWLALPGREAPVNLSEELLRQGLARAIRSFSYPGKEGFLALEAQARAARKGMWRRSPR